MEFVKGIYRSLLPRSLRRKIALRGHAERGKELKKQILDYYASLEVVIPEVQTVVDYLKTHELSVFPYAFQEKYKTSDVDVLRDANNGLWYVKHENKKLYFKRSWSASEARDYYKGLVMEQDEQSPHRYLTGSFDVTAGNAVADVGCAEGNFALSVVERVTKLYLFETDPEWIEALQVTFEPFRTKVEIIHQAVSDVNGDKQITLDTFFANKQLDFIKMDVDGGEAAALRGANSTLEREKLKIAMCAYHQANDEATFTQLLTQKQFHVKAPNGFMIFYFDKTLAPPYLRRGVLRAVKR